jgi:type II secretory pathway pseudopilin PulG
MTHLRASRYGGQARGFTVVELLVAMTLTLVIAGAIAKVAPPARAVFDRVPAELELQQRGRAAIDALTETVRSAGRDVVSADALGSLGDLLPAVTATDPGEEGTFTTLSAIVPVVDAAQGVLDGDQPAPGGSITLATAPCPNVKDVCGFQPGAAAAIADGLGHVDVFTIAATNPGARRLTPNGVLSRAYPSGSVIVEVEQHTFSLAEQADHTYSLVRETAAGAVQPMVDFVSALSFSVIEDEARPRQVEVSLSVQAPTEALRLVIADRVFRTTISLRSR